MRRLVAAVLALLPFAVHAETVSFGLDWKAEAEYGG